MSVILIIIDFYSGILESQSWDLPGRSSCLPVSDSRRLSLLITSTLAGSSSGHLQIGHHLDPSPSVHNWQVRPLESKEIQAFTLPAFSCISACHYFSHGNSDLPRNPSLLGMELRSPKTFSCIVGAQRRDPAAFQAQPEAPLKTKAWQCLEVPTLAEFINCKWPVYVLRGHGWGRPSI